VAGQALQPVPELVVELAALRSPVLPPGEIRVLHGQVRQGRRPARSERRVQPAQLVEQHLGRPAIGDEVVHHQAQHMVLGTEPNQRGAQHPAGRQVERLA